MRCRGLRDKIDPAQVFTLFLFLLGFLDIEDLLELGSVDRIGKSEVAIAGKYGVFSAFLTSFADDAALVGRDFGDDSPE